jgi:Asp/Glu/hydantoin racemase
MIVKGGRAYYGESIGILMFDNRRYGMAPGDVGNASTYDFPVRTKVVDGLNWYPGPQESWGDPRPAEVDLIVDAARGLQDDGVRAIVTCCGFFAPLQNVLAREVGIPIFTSPLILLPLLLRMISPDKKIAVVTASKPHLKDEFILVDGLSNLDRITLVGAETSSEFMETHMGGTRTDVDISLLEEQVVDIVDGHVREHSDVGMIMLECTSFPTFAAAVQERTELPVVDYVGFIEFVNRTVVARRYNGFV